MNESSNAVADWAPDSKSVILISNRSGHNGIYRQDLDKETADPLDIKGYDRDAVMSPDGKNVFYLGTGDNGPWPAVGPEPVMRVAFAGGPPQRLLTASWSSLLACARRPSDLCAIGEPSEDGNQLIVSSFNAERGRGPELFRFALASREGKGVRFPFDQGWRMSLSPDGNRFVALRGATSPIYILSSRGKVLREIRVRGWNQVQSVVWSADGKSLFVTADNQDGGAVLHVSLQGKVDVLWENYGLSWETLAHPSPDGRYLEFDRWTTSGNMWMMENF
jgi:Tol biopolymer transport system component